MEGTYDKKGNFPLKFTDFIGPLRKDKYIFLMVEPLNFGYTLPIVTSVVHIFPFDEKWVFA